MIGFWVLLLLLIALVASAPYFPHSRAWGYWPAAVLSILTIVWLAVIFLGFVAFALPWVATPAV